MLFASGFFEEVFFQGFAGVLLLMWLVQSYVKKHPEVKDAAGKAASKKAIDLIQRFLR